MFDKSSYASPEDEDGMYDESNVDTKTHNERENDLKNETPYDKKPEKTGSMYDAYGIEKPDKNVQADSKEGDHKANANGIEGSEDSGAEIFRINKEELTKDEVIAKATDFFGLDISKMEGEAQDKQIQAFVSMQNQKAASDSYNQRNQDLAKSRKEFEAEQEKFKATKQAEFEEINNYKISLGKREAALEKKANVDLSQIYDDDDKENAREERISAKLELKQINKEKEDLERSIQEIESDITERTLTGLVYNLQSTFPELVTDKAIPDLIEAYEGNREVDISEVQRAEAVRDIVTDYIDLYGRTPASEKPSIEKFYEIKRYKYNIPASTKENSTVNKSLPEEKARLERERIAAQIKAQSNAPIEPRSPSDFGVKSGMDSGKLLGKLGY